MILSFFQKFNYVATKGSMGRRKHYRAIFHRKNTDLTKIAA